VLCLFFVDMSVASSSVVSISVAIVVSSLLVFLGSFVVVSLEVFCCRCRVVVGVVSLIGVVVF